MPGIRSLAILLVSRLSAFASSIGTTVLVWFLGFRPPLVAIRTSPCSGVQGPTFATNPCWEDPIRCSIFSVTSFSGHLGISISGASLVPIPKLTFFIRGSKDLYRRTCR